MTSNLETLLESKFNEADGWVFLREVRSAAGFDAKRTADFLAMGIWPSRGLELHGFEMKLSRGDWLKELKDPSKADPVFRFCDRWWLVVGDKSIVRDGELPKPWGLMVPRGKGLSVKVQAPQLAPEPLDRSFVVAMLKRASQKPAPDPLGKKECDEAYQTGFKAAKESVKWKTDQLERGLKSAQQVVFDFESVSGLRIDQWDRGDVAAAVATLRELDWNQAGGLLSEAKRFQKNLVRHGETVGDLIANLENDPA